MKNDKTMKVVVLKRFRDKFDGKTRYQPGEVVEFVDERAKDLIERGLAKAEEVIEESSSIEPDTPPVDQQDDADKTGEIGETGKDGDEGEDAKEEIEPEPEPETKAKPKPKAKGK